MPSSRPPSRAGDRGSIRVVDRAAGTLDVTNEAGVSKGNEVVAPGRAQAEARGVVASEARKAPARMVDCRPL